MLKVFYFCFCLLVSLNSDASNATIELLRSKFKNAHRPNGESFIGTYTCHFTHVDGHKVQKLEASLSSHGERFIFTVLDNREVPHTEIVIDNGNDYVSSFEVWGL